jgi:MFS family permease
VKIVLTRYKEVKWKGLNLSKRTQENSGFMEVETQAEIGGFRAWVNWAICVLFVVLEITLLTGYAITNIYVAKDLNLTIAQVGLIGTIYTWVFAITQLASGPIFDRLSTRWVLPIACLIVSAGAFLFANSTNPTMLIVANILAAVGSSFGFIGAGFVGRQWFEPIKYGFMFSLVQFFAALSAIAGQRILAALVVDVPWDQLINGLGFIGVVISVLMALFLREPEKEGFQNSKREELKAFGEILVDSLAKVASIRDTWINALIGGVTMGTMLGLGVIWGPRVLIAGGMEPGGAFSVSSLAWAGLAFGSPAFAWISDTMRSRVKPMAVGCALQMVAIIIVIAYPQASSFESSILFFIFGFMAGGSMLPFTIGSELVPASLIGTSAAVVNATQFIFGGIMMVVPGQVLEGTGMTAQIHENSLGAELTQGLNTFPDYQWALSIMPGALAIALFLCLFLKETYSSQ